MNMTHKQFTVAAVVEIARHQRDDPNGLPIGAKPLSSRFGLPQRGLEAHLQSLRSAGLLRGIRGPHGGYALAKQPKAITVQAIMAALVTAPVHDLPPEIADLPEVDRVESVFQRAADAAETLLSRVTIADLLAQVPEQKAAA